MICTAVSYLGSVDALQGGLKPLQCGCDWFKTSTQTLKPFFVQGFATKHNVL